MTPADSEAKPTSGLRQSIFWRVALVLVGALLAIGLLAVALSAWFAFSQSRELVANSLRLRLDGLAEEVELRADSLEYGFLVIPPTLRNDLATRFPDPLTLVDAGGNVLTTISPDLRRFPSIDAKTPPAATPPADIASLLDAGDIVVSLDETAGIGSWGLAPVYDPSGLLVGGLLVQPMENSTSLEYEGVRAAYVRAMSVVALLAFVTAIILGGLLTFRLVRPIRRITRQVERLGAGDYASRIEHTRQDELGRLAYAVNQMAGRVEESIEDLRSADELRRELIANVGHDLRTPLAALQGYVEEAQRYAGRGDTVKAQAALATAERQSQYITRLVQDLFDLAVLDSGRAPLRLEPVPVAELLTDVGNAHRSAFMAAGVDFEVQLAPALPTVQADGVKLLRMMDNLLSNARHHTGQGGSVWLRARVDDAAVLLEVTDTGRGMTADDARHVFERYYRGSDARTRNERGGTGLGLPISIAIARAHGGDIDVESQPGRGSTFRVTIPLVSEAAPDAS